MVTDAGSTLAYTEGDPATEIDTSLTITDVDDTNIESATITISGGLVSAEDVLSFTDANGITGSYVAATGVLTLTGTATLAEYEAALETVKYQNSNGDNPNTGNRTVTWVVHDGDTDSAGVASTITVAAVNDAPAGADKTVSATEDTDFVFAASDFGFSDTSDTPANSLLNIIIASAPANGILYVDANGDGVVDAGEAQSAGSTVSVANINAGNLKFKPATNTNVTIQIPPEIRHFRVDK